MIVTVSKRFGVREIDVDIGVVFCGGFAMRLHRHDSVCCATGTVLLWRVCFSVYGDEIDACVVDFMEGIVRGVEIGAFRVRRSLEQPGSCFSFFVGDVSIVFGVGKERLVAVVIEGCERDAFVAACEGISGVDVVVAGDTE